MLRQHIKILIKIFKLSANPPSFNYPIPLLAFLVFSLSTKDLNCLIVAIAFTSVSQAGINLWNHANDIDEDILAGKNNILTQNPNLQKKVAFLSFMLYVLSFVILFNFSKNVRISFLTFFVVSFVTWIYSDKLFIGKFIFRWKDYYLTEILTYIVAIPLYTLTVWTLFSDITIKAIAVAVCVTFFVLSGMFLKDIKDITGDEKAGLKTLATVFLPSTLLKISVLLMWIYYIMVAFLSCIILPRKSILALIPSTVLIYSTCSFLKEDWIISEKLIKPIKLMIVSSLLSLTVLATANLLFQA